MGQIKKEAKVLTETFLKVKSSVPDDEKDHACGPIAVSVLVGQPYNKVAELFKDDGKMDFSGASIVEIREVLKTFGLKLKTFDPREILDTFPIPKHGKVTFKNITSHQPERYPTFWPAGSFLFANASHCWAVVDGINHDWTKGRKIRAKFCYKVS